MKEVIVLFMYFYVHKGMTNSKKLRHKNSAAIRKQISQLVWLHSLQELSVIFGVELFQMGGSNKFTVGMINQGKPPF